MQIQELHYLYFDRLLDRVQPDDNSQVEAEILYQAYRLETIDSFANRVLLSCRTFGRYVRQIYQHVTLTRTMKDSKKSNIYSGVGLKQIQPLNQQEFDYDNDILVRNVPVGFIVASKTNTQLTLNNSTEYYSNGNCIVKSLTFSSNKSWSLEICQKKVNLDAIEITPTYSFTRYSIGLVCKQVSMIKLCEGVTVTQTVVCSRYHILEHLTLPGKSVSTRKIRSILCQRVVSIISATNICRNCQKMTCVQKTSTVEKTTEPTPEFRNEEKSGKETANANTSAKQNVSKEDFKKLIPGATDPMLELLMSQAQNIGRKAPGRRWSSSMVSVCLQLYSRSPNAYKTLQASKMLVLPSTSLLILYKNSVKHDIGFHAEVFHWMFKEARRLELPDSALVGGIILDEMSVQTDLQIAKNGDVVELVGFEDLGPEGNMLQTLRKGKIQPKLGTHVLQFVFLGLSGFRFPFAHFLSTQVQAPVINSLFWEAVDHLQMFGFTTVFTCMDGAQSNRSFLHINIDKDSSSMCAKNPCDLDESVIFMMDYSHAIKKVRNNIIKSGIKKGCTRNLISPTGNAIQWQMWIDCFTWDSSNGVQVHRKLTKEHIYPTTQSKMRNHLAEQVLNDDMLELFTEYQSHLGNKGSALNGPIELLKRTSRIIEIFRDYRPVRDISDHRLLEVNEVLQWFKSWESKIESDAAIPQKQKGLKLMSAQCREDLNSCLTGFIQLCQKMNTRSTRVEITPALINSDIVENTFNQQRSTYNGANSNPNALQYRKSLNSIILGQNVISHKANAGKSKAPAMAYTLQSQRTGKRVVKRKSDMHANATNRSIKVIRF